LVITFFFLAGGFLGGIDGLEEATGGIGVLGSSLGGVLFNLFLVANANFSLSSYNSTI
jgi:hypothetical protein